MLLGLRPFDALCLRLAVNFGMQLGALLGRRLFFLHLGMVRLGVGAVPDARHLPGNLSARRTAHQLRGLMLPMPLPVPA